MKKSFISILNDVILYLFSIALAIGSIIPFLLYNADESETESLLLPVLAVVFSGIVTIRYGFFVTSRNIVVFSLLLLLGCFLGDFLYNSNSMNTRFLLKLLVVLITFICCITYFSNNPQRIKDSIVVYTISCVIVLIVVYFFGPDGIIQISKGRMSVFGENANSTSSRMVFAALFIMYDLVRNKRNIVFRLLEIVSFLLLLLYIVQSGSRGSFISVAIGIALMTLFSAYHTIKKIIIIITGVIVVLIAVPVLKNDENISFFERFEELETGNIRSELMLNAIDIYEDYPIFGVGYNGYQVEKKNRRYSDLDSHCIVTSIMAIGGTFALISFLLLWIIMFIAAFKVRKSSMLPLIINICISFIALKTGGVITYVFMWYCYALSYSLAFIETSNIATHKDDN